MPVQTPRDAGTEAPPQTFSHVHLKVDGMVCAGCAASVQSALESKPGVASASVSVTDGRATVRGFGLDPQPLVEAIEARGFHATPESEELAPAELRSEIELRQQRNERAWRVRATIGLSIWAPLEFLHWFGHGLFHWPGLSMDVLMFVGSTVVIALVGSGFYRSAWNAARKRTTNMDTLISIGATAAYVFSLVVFASMLLGRPIEQPLYFTESAALLGLISLGHWLEARAATKAGSAVRELLELQPDEAEIMIGGQDPDIATPGLSAQTRTIASAAVVPGDRILIRPGGRIPVDGAIVEGESEIDESVVTGEPLPVRKGVGATVVAGSMNTTGRLVIEATVDGRHTTVSRIADLVRNAQTSKAEIQRLADYISSIFVPTVLAIGAATFLGWWLIADNPAFGLIAMVTVLIISCPCALGLATPMAVMVGAGAASRRGILIKSAAALERASTIHHVVFDKTGTLTGGRPVVSDITTAPEIDEDELLRLAASVETPSEHPIARAIVRAANDRGIATAAVDDFQAIPGRGVRGVIDGKAVEVLRAEAATCRVIADGRELGTIDVTDEVRPDAKAAIERLRSMGYAVTMLSGDRRNVAEAIGASIGLSPEEVVAEATPEQKTEFIKSFKHGVIMVGDGINDAAALAEADLGIAMASGTNIAIESADVVIPGDRVMAVPQTIALSRQTLRTIKQNLFLAFLYNTAAIPIAAFGLLGMRGPLIAAAAMAASDISVVGNALRLMAKLRRRKE